MKRQVQAQARDLVYMGWGPDQQSPWPGTDMWWWRPVLLQYFGCGGDQFSYNIAQAGPELLWNEAHGQGLCVEASGDFVRTIKAYIVPSEPWQMAPKDLENAVQDLLCALWREGVHDQRLLFCARSSQSSSLPLLYSWHGVPLSYDDLLLLVCAPVSSNMGW